MNKKLVLCSLLLYSLVNAEPCQLNQEKSLETLQKVAFDSKYLKVNYQNSVFGNTYILELTYQGKPIVTFSNKNTTPLTISTDYAAGEFPTMRQAFESTYKLLSFKLWLIEKAQRPVQVDLSKLTKIADFNGKCSANLSSLDKMISEFPIVEEPTDTVAKTLTPVPKSAPDRSLLTEQRPFRIDVKDRYPTR